MAEEMSIAKSHVKYVFYMADYDIMSGAKLYQTRSAEHGCAWTITYHVRKHMM